LSDAVLVIDDDKQVCQLLTELLERDGYAVSVAHLFESAREIIQRASFDAVIVDQIMPDGHGLEFAQSIRRNTDAAIIVLTGRLDPTDRILALELAADDYITKPFHNRELLARLRAVLRRTRGDRSADVSPDRPRQVHCFGRFEVDVDARQVRNSDGAPIRLTTQEFDVLAVLVSNPHAVLAREGIIESAGWRKSAG